MQCFRCQAENAEGSRFCGNCGASLELAPRHFTDPTRELPQDEVVRSGLPPLGRDGRPVIDDAGMSLGDSLRAAVGGGGRGVMIAGLLLVDLAMVVVGVVLMTRSGGEAGTGTVASGVGVGNGDGGGSRDGGGGVGGGGGAGSNVVVVEDAGRVGRGTGRGTGVVVVRDAAVVTARIDAGIVIAAPDAAVVAPSIDAGVVVVPVDAGRPPPDADQSGDTDTAAALRDEVNVHLQSSQSHLSRCYSEATKALPEDQALSGEVDISFEVLPTGGTRNVAVARNTTGSDQLAGCLSSVVGNWTFDPFTGDSVTFVRTFRFAASGHS